MRAIFARRVFGGVFIQLYGYWQVNDFQTGALSHLFAVGVPIAAENPAEILSDRRHKAWSSGEKSNIASICRTNANGVHRQRYIWEIPAFSSDLVE